MGPNLDILMEYLKRPWIFAGIVTKNSQNQLSPIRDIAVRKRNV
jgi:hypothetical protein